MRISVKKLTLLLGAVLLLVACKPSDKYAGEWYALTGAGEQVIVNFSPEKELTISNEQGDVLETADFNQNQTGFINNVRYFGIEMDAGYYYVVFDNKKDESNAKLILQTNHASDFEDAVGDVLFIMNREAFPEQ